ncbi:bifunctional RNase H/acid phosphatase [Nocardioides sp. DS6]|uniref:Bifunctional RNase H/acid phosphatase n=1 Tax=Nocardioides eburneus TaxID=3231482 RepID=A0ABV3SY07_9ACTN
MRSVIIEADGGSRGNPGQSAYGAVLKDAETGEVIAEDGTTIGVATNNVAEYRGLIAGLELAREFAPDAEIEVRMDSKLVVEQMSGRWKIKHPDMRPLALEANRLAPFGTTFTWVPRERNKHADRLANEALDGLRSGVTVAGGADESLVAEVESPSRAEPRREAAPAPQPPAQGWGKAGGPATTLILLRHGVTPHTLDKRFSGGLGGANPGLSDDGRAQVRLAAEWLAPAAERVSAVVASPVRRTRESAEIAAAVLGAAVVEEPGFAETEFGAWDGLTFAEVGEKYPDQIAAWLGSLDVAPEGGESFRAVEARVLAGLDRVLETYAGQAVVIVSHVTPIKILVARALKAPLEAVYAMELSPASVSVVAFYPDASGGAPRASLRLYNALPPERDAFSAAATQW